MPIVLRRVVACLAVAVGVVVSTAAGAGPSRAAVSVAPVVYIAGDSTAASAYLYAPARDGFVPQMSARICGMYCNTATHTTVVNVTRGGQRLTGTDPTALVNTWDSILASTPTPTTIIVAIGINDMALVSDTVWSDAYKSIVFRALDRGIRVIPATMLPCNNHLASCPTLDPQRVALNGWLKSYWGASAVADTDAYVRLPWADTLDNTYDHGDGLHPNPYGVLRMTQAVPLDRIV